MSEVLIDASNKQVLVVPELGVLLPEAQSALQAADASYQSDPELYLKNMAESVFSFTSSTGAEIDCSLIPGKGSELFVVWAPFSDSAPQSSAEHMYAYVSGEDVSKQKAAPNSWNQLTKSAVMYEVLKATDKEMPVLTIFSPLPAVPHNAYSHVERKMLKTGDFTPSARITEEAMAQAQDRLHGPKSETQLSDLHLHGASLGASSALGAASALEGVQTVTAQELIVAPRNLADLALRFTVKGTHGVSEVVAPDVPRINEPTLRQAIDSDGNELMMVGRMLQGMAKPARLKGLIGGHKNATIDHIETLAERGVSVAIPLAENSGLTHDTSLYLPNAGEKIIHVRAIEGQSATHLIDEHVALTALLAAAHVKNS